MNRNSKKNRTVLLVDDDEAFCTGIRRIVQSPPFEAGLQIAESGTGAHAIEILGRRDVDVVLLDYLLPDCSGLDCLERMLSARSRLVVIMLTGEGSEEIAVEAMKKGAADYLVKTSLSRIRLHHAVKSALERAEMLQTIDRQREELLCAERQRVMIESLGAACHHLSQPATAIVACLDILKNSDQSSNMREVIASCIEAAERMSDVFRRLQAVTEYRTEPYLQTGDKESPHPEERIVRI